MSRSLATREVTRAIALARACARDARARVKIAGGARASGQKCTFSRLGKHRLAPASTVAARGGATRATNDDLARLHAPSLHRFYVDADFARGAAVTLSREETRHATKALRLKPGDRLEVCDGRGTLGIARLCAVDGVGATVEVEEMVADALGSGTAWDVASAFGGLKGGRGDWLVEKCAELGARTLVPLLTTRSGAIGGGDRDGDKKRSGNRRASGGDDDGSTASGREGRWGRVAHAASKQSLRVYGLQVAPPIGVEALCEEIAKDCGERLTLLAAAGAPPIADVARASGLDLRSGRIVIGPEGDFTDDELKAMIAAGARPVGLGSLRLRVETAAISALAAVSALAEEKGA